jgi:ABC-2 type transport system ATP-binding protein
MRQRLALAQALLPRPEVVLLDEPAEGLDPEGIHEMRHLILQLNRERGMTVLLSSHLLSEVEQMCSRVAILNQGRLVFQGRWSELAKETMRFRLKLDDWEKAKVVLQKHGATFVETGVVELLPNEDIAGIVTALVQAGVRVSAVEPMRQTLEQIYLGTVSAP